MAPTAAGDGPAHDAADAWPPDRVAAAMAATATTSTPRTFRLGTGASVFATALLPAMRAARREILLVTCFWAPSESLRALADTLAGLADARRAAWAAGALPPLRVRVGFSSRSLAQKLFHTASPAGCTYAPADWAPVLGLPPPPVLAAAGIDLAVKSVFFRPVSVLHPKLVVVDRRRAFLPSCNVSWESWLEACVEVVGDAVPPLLAFYAATWHDDLPPLPPDDPDDPDDPDLDSNNPDTTETTFSPVDVDGPGSIVVRFPAAAPPIPTDVLPSPHHRNPRIALPRHPPPPPPATALNDALLRLFAAAADRVFVVTPNLTAGPVLAALHAALARGVAVDVVTSDRMMVWEQLATAWTTTARCVRRLADAVRRERRPGWGRLRVYYYAAAATPSSSWWWPWSAPGPAAPTPTLAPAPPPDEEHGTLLPARPEPVLCHVKLTLVDGVHTVLGSGNMDRASWFTSQELGILFHDAALAQAVQTAVDRVLDGRVALAYEV